MAQDYHHGVRLQPLMDMDVDSMMQVLPRITMPTLTKKRCVVFSRGRLGKPERAGG